MPFCVGSAFLLKYPFRLEAIAIRLEAIAMTFFRALARRGSGMPHLIHDGDDHFDDWFGKVILVY